MSKEVYILGAARTPIGAFLGGLKDVAVTELGAVAIRAAVERSGVEPDRVDEVLMGNVLQSGVGQAPARQSLLAAGLPKEVSATTINKVCGSGMKAVTLGYQAILSGESEIVVAGGMESMSRAPYILDRARCGYRLGNAELVDSMMKDGLVDAASNISMGVCAEMVADKYNITRDEQDDFAVESFSRARSAWEHGAFKDEVVPVSGLERDEALAKFDGQKIRRLKTAFKTDGTITAANSSSLADGAAALVLASDQASRSVMLSRPLARVVACAQAGVEPVWFGLTPALAMRRALEKAGLTLDDIDIFEINEAFAVITIASINELAIDPGKVNPNGGVVALGHPIGATGARIIVTLVHALKAKKGRYGLASLCIGGGEGMAVIVERV